MDKQAYKIYDIINIGFSNEKISAIAKTASKKYDILYDILKEVLLSDNKLFNLLFLQIFENKMQYEIVSKYLNITKESIILSPKSEEIINFSSSIILYEQLSSLYNKIKFACEIPLEEFVVLWYSMNYSGEFTQLIIDKNISDSLLNEDTKKIINKIKTQNKLKESFGKKTLIEN